MKVLVIGASGGFGGGSARELLARGHEVRALMRPGGRKPQLPGAELVEGDALDPLALSRAARGVDAIIWGFHVPYAQWRPTAIEAARVTAEVAAQASACLLVPGNLYGLGPDFSQPLAEDCPRRAPTKKGAIRNEIEALFEAASERGAQLIVLRAGDYLGPNIANTWFEEMTRRATSGGAIFDPAPEGVLHSWAYQPDVVRAGIDLLERRRQLSRCEYFHFAGYNLDSATMIAAIADALGDPQRKVRRVPWWLVRGASVFSRLLREILEMRYLWNEPVRLDGSKLARTLPDFRSTPLDEAVTTTLAAIAAANQTRAEPEHALQWRKGNARV